MGTHSSRSALPFSAVFAGIGLIFASWAGCDGPATPPGAGDAGPSTTAAAVAADSGADAAPEIADAGQMDGGDAGDAGDAGDPDAGDAGVEPSCPEDMVKSSRFVCIDRFEGYLVTVSADGAVTPFPYYQVPEMGVTYFSRNEKDVFPQAYISRTVAAAACKASGKRLCKREEWMRACRGPKGWQYPYAPRFKQNRCNSGKSHLLQEFFGNDPHKWSYDDVFNNPKLAQEPGYLAKSGFYQDCVTVEGAYDMVGNLHEWVSDSVGDDLLELMEKEKMDRQAQPHRDGNGAFMGGFFSTTTQHGPGCYFTTIAHEPKYHDYSTGYRCCKSLPKPPKEPKPKKGSGKK